MPGDCTGAACTRDHASRDEDERGLRVRRRLLLRDGQIWL
jgi:hypothetical protein